MRRLVEFRAVNTEDETVMNYFDELEIHPDHIGKFSLFKMELICWPAPEVELMWDIQGRWNSNPLLLRHITCQGYRVLIICQNLPAIPIQSGNWGLLLETFSAQVFSRNLKRQTSRGYMTKPYIRVWSSAPGCSKAD